MHSYPSFSCREHMRLKILKKENMEFTAAAVGLDL
jgi:hypothetical protein